MRIEILKTLKPGKGDTWEFTGHIIDGKSKIPIGGNVPQNIKTDTRLKKVIMRKAKLIAEKYEQSKMKPKQKTLEEDSIFVSKI